MPHPTPDIVRAIIAAFKQQQDALLLRALATEEESLVPVSFRWEDMIVEAWFQKETASFVRLVASPFFEPDNDAPAVVYDITPPEGELWR